MRTRSGILGMSAMRLVRYVVRHGSRGSHRFKGPSATGGSDRDQAATGRMTRIELSSDRVYRDSTAHHELGGSASPQPAHTSPDFSAADYHSADTDVKYESV